MDGNKHVYETYLHKSANKGNPEAMYLLGMNIINNPKNSPTLKRDGEGWVIKSADCGYELAINLATKYGLALPKEKEYKARVVPGKNLVKAINSSRKRKL